MTENWNPTPMKDVVAKLDHTIQKEDVELYGTSKAKLNFEELKKNRPRRAKLVLVTATSPTKYGEGKTTVSIGLIDGMNRTGRKTVGALREPSLGPVFGIKGGATGGGKAQVYPMDDINLHFTGDFHAITSANNLLSAMIDNHIFQGNALRIDPESITFTRCMDMNDRALRRIGLDGRSEEFVLTAASEVMAVFCLAKDREDLKKRLGGICFGRNLEGNPLYCRDLKAEGAMYALLKDAINPNLVQTLEHNPVIIHGGPFANVAHGCNSLIATDLALRLGDYVVTEAGFGSDLGAEKFIDIKCKELGQYPDCVVLVTSIRGLKYNGSNGKCPAACDGDLEKHIGSLNEGFCNLLKHYRNITEVFHGNCVVAINQFPTDTNEEIKLLEKLCEDNGIECSLTRCFADGGDGAIDLADKVAKACQKPNGCTSLYSTHGHKYNILESIDTIARNVYGASRVEYSSDAKQDLRNMKDDISFPVCVAKTQYSFSDNAKLLGAPEGFVLNVDRLLLRAGARVVVAVCGGMMLMPGLPKVPNAVNMDVADDGSIISMI